MAVGRARDRKAAAAELRATLGCIGNERTIDAAKRLVADLPQLEACAKLLVEAEDTGELGLSDMLPLTRWYRAREHDRAKLQADADAQ